MVKEGSFIGGFDGAFEILSNCQSVFEKYLGRESILYADATYDLGMILNQPDKLKAAREKVDTSLNIYLAILGERNEKTANAYELLGLINREFNIDSAIILIQKAVEIRIALFGNFHENVANAWLNLGGCYQVKGEVEKALECYNKCIKVRKKLQGDAYIEDHNVLANLGSIYEALQRFEEAEKCYKKSLAIRKESNLISLLPNNYLQLCYLFGEMEKGDSFIIYGMEGLKVCRELGEEEGIMAAQIHHALGDVYNSIQDFRESQFQYELSLKLLQKNLGENHPFLTIPLNSLASNTTSGPSHALEYLFSALDICMNTGGYCPETYGNIAENYGYLNDWKNAIEFGWKSLKEYQKQQKINQFSTGIVWDNLGNYYTENRNLEKGLECYDSSLYTFNQLNGSGNSWSSLVLANIAGNYLRQNKLDLSESYHQQALNTYRLSKENDPRQLIQIYENWAEQKMREDEFDLAIPLLDSAILVASSSTGGFNQGFTESNIRVNALKGSFCLAKFKETRNEKLLCQAKDSYQRAESVFWECFNSSIRDDDKARLLQNLISISEGLLFLDYQQTNGIDKLQTFEQAFAVSEKSKSAILRSAINESKTRQFFGIPDSLLDREYHIKTRIAYLDLKKNEFEKSKANDINPEFLEIQHQLFILNKQLDSFSLELEANYPTYHRLKYDLTTIPLEEVQNTLLAPAGQALLEYFTGDSSIFIFVVKKGEEPHLVEVKKDFPLEEWVEKFHRSLHDETLSGQYAEYGQKLYDKLVDTVAQWLPERVVVVPDGVLGNVPFGALLSGEPGHPGNYKTFPFLVRKYQFSYCYSATLLREMQQKQHRQTPEKAFAAFAPVYDGEAQPLANRSAFELGTESGLAPLPNSEPEARKAAGRMGGGDVFPGGMALKEVFQEMAPLYRTLYLVMHGKADSRVGDYAFLAFTAQKEQGDDGLLYVRDLYNLQLNADLVVLSACETGIGKLRRGEGIISLARAFAYAGAKAIVTTLWSVSDLRTAEVMDVFYRELAAGKDKDWALRTAQLEYLGQEPDDNVDLHPKYWAAFLPVGDMLPIEK